LASIPAAVKRARTASASPPSGGSGLLALLAAELGIEERAEVGLHPVVVEQRVVDVEEDDDVRSVARAIDVFTSLRLMV
jgi:hypothetical protein